MNRLRYVRRLRSFLRRPSQASAVSIEERFWDEYVIRLRARLPCQLTPSVCSDRGNEEAFLKILQRHGDAEQRALEIGCGGGRITAVGANVFAHVYAADLSEEMLRECQTGITAPNVSSLKLDGMTFSVFADASIDLVYSTMSRAAFVSPDLSVPPGDPPRAGDRRHRRDFLLPLRRPVRLACEHSLRYCRRRGRLADRRLHFVTEEMLRAMLDDAGCEVVDVEKGRFDRRVS